MKRIGVTYIFLWMAMAFAYPQHRNLDSLVQDSIKVYNNDLKEEDHLRFSVETGMSFSSFGSGIGSTGKFIYPKASYTISEKLNFNIGTYFLQNSFSGLTNHQGMNIPNHFNGQDGYSTMSGFINANATFNITDKLNLTGFMMKGFGNRNQQLLQNYYTNMSLMGIGIDYEILPNLSIGAQFNYLSRPSRFSPFESDYYSPFAPGHSPYGW